jgi:5-methylcytosine-specific restriction endonuclease McrA
MDQEKYICKPKDNTTLVLSQAWLPIRITNAETAMVKLVGSHAGKEEPVKAINAYGVTMTWNEWISTDDHISCPQPYLRTRNEMLPVPTILLTTTKWNYKQKGKHDVSYLYARFKGTCQICGNKFPMKEMSLEHVDPRSRGGADDASNTTLTCKKCNSHKGSIFPYNDLNGRQLKPAKPLPFFHTFTKDRPEWEPFLFKA